MRKIVLLLTGLFIGTIASAEIHFTPDTTKHQVKKHASKAKSKGGALEEQKRDTKGAETTVKKQTGSGAVPTTAPTPNHPPQ